MSRLLFLFSLLCVLSVWALPQGAFALSPTQLMEAQRLLLAQSPQIGSFEQNQSGKQKRYGRYWLDFPYNFRFAYTAAKNQKAKNKKVKSEIITINKTWVSVQDYAGATANRFPVAATPLALLHKYAKGDFAPQTLGRYIAAFEVRGAQTAMTLRDPEAHIGGSLTLYFNSLTKNLLGWRVLDLQNQRIDVRLFDVAYKEALPRRHFVVQEKE